MRQRITDIQAVPELPSHRQLFFDGTPFVVLHAALVENFGLRIGLQIEAEVIEKLIAADEVMRAKNYALRLLREETNNEIDDEMEDSRPTVRSKTYTKSEMERRLTREGFSEEAVEAVVAELIRLGAYSRPEVRRELGNP